jgi:phosphoglycerate dehydrogenase-like enzyme
MDISDSNRLRAHLLWAVPPEDQAILETTIGNDIDVSFGTDLPDGAAIDILICGRPTREQVEACATLSVLLIPYAGLPAETREMMRDFPDIAVHNLHHNAAPTAEMALGLLLAAAKHIIPMDRKLREGVWSGRTGRSPAVLLEGRTALVLGFGAIGRRLARTCRAMGMDVIAVRGRISESETVDDTPVVPVARLNEVLVRADVLLVCAPFTDETRGLIGREEIALLPENAVLVNIARGPIVDEHALYEALAEGSLGAAGLDVWYRYPGREGDPNDTLPSSRPFADLDNVVMSPHRGGAVLETETLRMQHLAEALEAAAAGEALPNPVDLDLGY